MARLLFLGRLEDVAGMEELSLPLARVCPLAEVMAMLPGELVEALRKPNVKIAVNGVIVAAEGLAIADTDEVAFLPPVSGG